MQAVRQVEDLNGNIRYFEKSPPSPQSDPIHLNHQTLQITIDGTTRQQLDLQQTDQLWIYLFGGWLDAYYRFAVVPANPTQGMTIDELTTPAGSDLDSVSERARIPSWGLSYCQLNTSGVPEITASSDVQISLRTSESEALIDNQRLEPYLINPPDNIIDIAGPWKGRMFVLTEEGYVYPSLQTSPSSFNSLQVIDLTKYGDPLWIAATGVGVYVGCERDVIHLAGSGDNSPDLAQIDLYGQPLNIGNPPFDKMHWVEGNSVIYRSIDGLMMLTGSSAQPMPMAGTSLLWRGQARHGIQPLNIGSGRFRCAVGNYMLYMLAPEGTDTSGNVIYRYSFPDGQWSRLVFSRTSAFLSIFCNPGGAILAGSDDGTVWRLESSTQDDGYDIAIDLLTPIADGGQPLSAKDAFDVQLHMMSDSDTLTLSLYKDGDLSATSTYSASTTTPGIWRAQADDFGAFVKAQMQLTGAVSGFTLSAYNISYRVRPQRSMVFDTGYFMAVEPGDILWLQEVELDAIVNTSTFTMYVYVNDTLKWTSAAQTATTGKRVVYRIPMPRGIKGERVRLVFKGSDSTGTGETGIDAYSVRVRVDGSGNQDGNRTYQRVWPSGQDKAP
jgi:hypothetical protein